MRLVGKLEIKSAGRIAAILGQEHIGRIASIDGDGYPQVIPMNFAFLGGLVYMHSFPRGEKIENILRNGQVGFEVDRELEFLPSYFTHPTDASVADTLYYSVVIKGQAALVSDGEEKCLALNGLMEKYQPEGGYEPVTVHDDVLARVAVIRITPGQIRGKYKIGQDLKRKPRQQLAQRILDRGLPGCLETLDIMGFAVRDRTAVMVGEPVW